MRKLIKINYLLFNPKQLFEFSTAYKKVYILGRYKKIFSRLHVFLTHTRRTIGLTIRMKDSRIWGGGTGQVRHLRKEKEINET